MIVITAGLVSAEEEYIGVISNTTGIDISNFIAGSTTTANFSFDYEDIYDADKHYPLIFKINISYLEDAEECQLDDCSVWKNDFEIDGLLRRYYLFGALHKDIKLKCSEESPLTINHQMGSNTLDVPEGIFYCYNTTEGTIETLKKRNKIFLNIFSNPALYPATYKITAQMFYANDTYSPIVNITNKNDFNVYYREGNNIEVQATINENMGLSNKWGTIFTPTQNITVPFSHKTEGIYYFTKMLPNDIQEGNYILKITAEDTSGNIGNDSTTLKIDMTAPVITLVSPEDKSVVSEIIPLKINVTDEKSGTNQSSVYYRLREIISKQICPEIGVPLGNYSCARTDWINLPYNPTTGFYEKEVNTTELNLNSGEYWLDVKAKDILGNEGFLE